MSYIRLISVMKRGMTELYALFINVYIKEILKKTMIELTVDNKSRLNKNVTILE